MLLELTEILRCPADHEESYVVCVTVAVDGSRVTRGVIGCPACEAEYPIVDGVVEFGGAAAGEGAPVGRAEASTGRAQPGASERTPEHQAAAPLTAEAAATFLDLRGPGGYVMLVGAASRLAAEFAALVPGVHVVCVNAPDGAPRAESCSYLAAPERIPIKTAQVRGVVLGGDVAGAAWLAEGLRVVLGGLRLVVEDERASPTGLVELARGAGVLVGAKGTR